MKKHYIKAVTQLLLSGRNVEIVLSNLAFVLKKRGHESLHTAILQGVSKDFKLQATAKKTAVVVSKISDMKTYKQEIEKTLQALGGSIENAAVSIDSTLIGGYISFHQGKQINKSHKDKLVTLYKSVVK